MIVVDTSAWVEFLRASGSTTHGLVAALVQSRQVLVQDVVRLELLAGASGQAQAADLTRLLARFVPLPASSPADHELAASLYRRARRRGTTVRSLPDCLIAAMAVRVDAPLLARGGDFDVLARVCDLQLVGDGAHS